MSDSHNFGFAKLVPGFDFLQNLAKGAGGGLAQLPQMSSWVAPTLNVEELDKRIQELRAVHFWLEQNGKALAATIQALEVQKMTLSTLQGMNLSMNELAESLQLKPEKMPAGFAMPTAGAAAAKPSDEAPAARKRQGAKAAQSGKTNPADKAAADTAAQVDPMQWWGSLSQQFQQIAATALKDVAEAGAAVAPSPAGGPGKSARAASSKKPSAAKSATQSSPGTAAKRTSAASSRRRAA